MNDEPAIPESERRYPPRAVADAWSVNVRTVHRWIAEGLSAHNVGSSQRPDWRIRLGDVGAFLWERQRGKRASVASADAVESAHDG